VTEAVVVDWVSRAGPASTTFWVTHQRCACDDGNEDAGDGCSATCADELTDAGMPGGDGAVGGPDAGVDPPSGDGGCNCAVEGVSTTGPLYALFGFVALLFWRRSRRRH